jgi:hypothetical protein
VAEKSSLRSGTDRHRNSWVRKVLLSRRGVFRGAMRLTTIGLLIAVTLVVFEAMAVPRRCRPRYASCTA